MVSQWQRQEQVLDLLGFVISGLLGGHAIDLAPLQKVTRARVLPKQAQILGTG